MNEEDVTDLCRQLTEASERAPAIWREGYDAAMSDAHVTLNEWGYLGRRSRPNPYAPDDLDQWTGEPVD